MAEDTTAAVDQLLNLLVIGLKRRKEERIELERDSKNYWKGLKKRLPEELLNNLENDPENEAYQQTFKTAMIDLINAKQNVMMNTAIFLSKKGIEF